MALFNLKGNIPRWHHQTYRVSLACSICGGLLSIFGLSESLSCVTYTHEQRGFPGRCGFPADVELQTHWCWEPSYFSKMWVWCWALALLIDVVLEATGQFTLFTSQRPANFVHPCISAPVTMVATMVWGQEMANMMEWRSRSRHVDNRQRGTAGLWGLSKICTMASAFEFTRQIACNYTPWGVVLRCALKSGAVKEMRVSPESDVFGVPVPTSAPIHMFASILAWCLLVAACVLKLCTKLDWVSEGEVSKDIAEEAKRLDRAATTLVADVEAGKTVLPVAADSRFADGDLVTIGCRGQAERDRRIVGFGADSARIFTLDCAVQHAYAEGSRVSVRAQSPGGHPFHDVEARERNMCDRARFAVLRCLRGCDFELRPACGGGGASTTLAAAASRGATALTVASQSGFSPADVLEISDGSVVESRILSKIDSTSIKIDAPGVVRHHQKGTRVVKQVEENAAEVGYESEVFSRQESSEVRVFRKLSLVKRLMVQPDFKLRFYALIVQGLAAWLGFEAYMSDWLCVSEITVWQDVWEEAPAQLRLLGVCGRPSGVGVLEACTVWLLGILIVIQLLMAFSWKGDKVAFLANKLPLELDSMLQNVALGRERFPREPILCYVWVKKAAEPGAGIANLDRQVSGSSDPLDRIVCDCTNTRDERRSWRRSTEPVHVRVLSKKEFQEKKHDWRDEQKRLTRGMGFASVCIEIPCPHPGTSVFGRTLHLYQIVPKEFVVGSFTVELGLGSKSAYTKVSNCCSAMVCAMVCFDLFNFGWLNSRLDDCYEILSGPCRSIDPEAVEFRVSNGAVFAVLELLLVVCGWLMSWRADRMLLMRSSLAGPLSQRALPADSPEAAEVKLRSLLERPAWASRAACRQGPPAAAAAAQGGWRRLGQAVRGLPLPLCSCLSPKEGRRPLLAADG